MLLTAGSAKAHCQPKMRATSAAIQTDMPERMAKVET